MFIDHKTTAQELYNIKVGDYIYDAFNEGKVTDISKKIIDTCFVSWTIRVERKESNGLLKTSYITAKR